MHKISYDNKETNLQDTNKYKLNKRLKKNCKLHLYARKYVIEMYSTEYVAKSAIESSYNSEKEGTSVVTRPIILNLLGVW